MPPRNLALAIHECRNMPKPAKVIPKVVKRMTNNKGERLVLTSMTKDGFVGDKYTTLTLYKENNLAKGLNSYQKLEEKIVSLQTKLSFLLCNLQNS